MRSTVPIMPRISACNAPVAAFAPQPHETSPERLTPASAGLPPDALAYRAEVDGHEGGGSLPGTAPPSQARRTRGVVALDLAGCEVSPVVVHMS